ncbi:MAG: hypothetical protein OQK75_11990 [Gammaproteobacteria bacterium]|nr:hypothetical protein [Gammaproteobacteria bacterium]MCW8988376.1 hypothetical protein [Gammaproteobacteria bacterium]MCW9030180.1 hypothetical protein [Gammaproteobacteria bacterium]
MVWRIRCTLLHGSPHNTVSRIELAEHPGMSTSGVTRLVAPNEITTQIIWIIVPATIRLKHRA